MRKPCLTGSGAAINLLNDQFQPGQPIPPDYAAIQRNWDMLNPCLDRYRTQHQHAQADH